MTSAIEFCPDDSVAMVYVGGSVTIPCNFSISKNNSLNFDKTGKVTWLFSNTKEETPVEVITKGLAANEIYEGHVSVGKEIQNCSLVMNNVLEKFAGYYSCHIKIAQNVHKRSKYTKLYVSTRNLHPTNVGVLLELVLIIILVIYSITTTAIIIWGYKKRKRAAMQEIGSPDTMCKKPPESPKSADLYESLEITETPIYNQLSLKEEKVPKYALKPKGKLKPKVDVVVENTYENVNMTKMK
uniref:Ig-like domain-containing protein n=1 Tax=Eptatretus burgeri TaxID=7764 RepID=A0A8C4PY23_EPTBU